MSDLIADLSADYPSWMEDEQPGEVIATYKAERIRAAAALAAKDAEMREHQKALAAERADVAAALAEARDKLDAQDAEIASLRARLAAADVLAEKAGALCSPWLARHNPTKEMEETVAALAAYNAAKGASDAG